MSKETVAYRKKHLDWAAQILTTFYNSMAEVAPEDKRVTMTIKDDTTDTSLMKLEAEGIQWLVYALTAHRCAPSCDRLYGICPMMAMAWLIEGCPEGGQTITPELAMRGMNSTRTEENQ